MNPLQLAFRHVIEQSMVEYGPEICSLHCTDEAKKETGLGSQWALGATS